MGFGNPARGKPSALRGRRDCASARSSAVIKAADAKIAIDDRTFALLIFTGNFLTGLGGFRWRGRVGVDRRGTRGAEKHRVKEWCREVKATVVMDVDCARRAPSPHWHGGARRAVVAGAGNGPLRRGAGKRDSGLPQTTPKGRLRGTREALGVPERRVPRGGARP